MICPQHKLAALGANHAAIDLLRRGRTLLTAGVTGSGKTEVVIKATTHVVSQARLFDRDGAAHISLTPQTGSVSKVGSNPSHRYCHSQMSPSERHFHWQRIRRGEVQGRGSFRVSAVFAPLPKLVDFRAPWHRRFRTRLANTLLMRERSPTPRAMFARRALSARFGAIRLHWNSWHATQWWPRLNDFRMPDRVAGDRCRRGKLVRPFSCARTTGGGGAISRTA